MSYVPEVENVFYPTEISNTAERIISSETFFPFILYGETGVGKTYPIMQVCARLNRECFRVNLSKRSNEDNLIGGFRLENGSTFYEKGPVVLAMERGGVLLLDELDAADPEEVLCLQSVLEGNGYYIKAINEQIIPKEGFTIIATANTKGLGDDTGKYIGTNILNEAFLERFITLFTVHYPSLQTEEAILKSHASELGLDCEKFIERLVNWSFKIRDAIGKDSSKFNHNISTRRLIHILKTYSVFRDERLAMSMCLNRFDDYHKKAFLDFYSASFDDGETYMSVFMNDFRKLKPLK